MSVTPSHEEAIEALREAHGIRALLPAKKAAAVVGLTEGSLAHYRVTGDGPRFVRLANGRIFYDPKDLRAWREQLPTFSTTAEADAVRPGHSEGAVALDRYRAGRHKNKGNAA